MLLFNNRNSSLKFQIDTKKKQRERMEFSQLNKLFKCLENYYTKFEGSVKAILN